MKPSQSRVILCVGDSTTAGTPEFFSPRERPPYGIGNPESQYAYWIHQRKPEWELLNRGVRGQRTDQMLRRFSWDAEGLKLDAVIILGGVNDLHQDKDLKGIQNNLSDLFKRAQEVSPRVLACTLLPLNMFEDFRKEKILELNRWIEAAAKEIKIGFCDTYAALEDPLRAGYLVSSPDEIHPDVKGYRLMGERILQSILSFWPEMDIRIPSTKEKS